MLAVPYNMMVPGYHNGRVNTLRLWSATATRAFDLACVEQSGFEADDLMATYAELAKAKGMHIVGIQGADITDGNRTLTLGLVIAAAIKRR